MLKSVVKLAEMVMQKMLVMLFVCYARQKKEIEDVLHF